MTLYDYKIYFTNKQYTVFVGCVERIDLNTLVQDNWREFVGMNKRKFIQMQYVVCIEETAYEADERTYIQAAMKRNNGDRAAAARELGISERTLYRKIKEYGIE